MESTLPVISSNPLPKMGSKKAIAQAAKAKLAELEAQKKQVKAELQSLTKDDLGRADLWESHTQYSRGKKYMVENQYPGPHADWLQNKVEGEAVMAIALPFIQAHIAQKQADKVAKAQAQISKAQETLAKLNQPEIPEYENGNLMIDVQMPNTHTDVLNLVADSLGSKKSKGQKIFTAAHLPELTPKQAKVMDILIKDEYITSPRESHYTLTDKGLALFGLTWAEALENLNQE